MIELIGWLGFALLVLYEIVGIVNPRFPTISEFLWKKMENKWFRAAFFFTWVWLTVHFFAPKFFE